MLPRCRLLTTILLVAGSIVGPSGCASKHRGRVATHRDEPRSHVVARPEAKIRDAGKTAAAPFGDDENPFRRNQPARRAFVEKEPDDRSPRTADRSGARRTVRPAEPDDDSEPPAPAKDADSEARVAAPAASSRADADLQAMIDEEVRHADAQERADLARELRAMDPALARQVVLFRRYARRVGGAEEGEAERPVRHVAFKERAASKDRPTSAADDRRDEPRSRDDASRRAGSAAPPLVLNLNAAPSATASPLAPSSVGAADAFPLPPAAPLWSAGAATDRRAAAPGHTTREMQQLFDMQRAVAAQTPGSWSASPSAGVGTQRSLFGAVPSGAASLTGAFVGDPARSPAAGLFSPAAARAPSAFGTPPSSPIQTVSASALAPAYGGPPGELFADGLTSPAAQADLHRLIAVAERDAAVARLRPEATDAERRLYIEKHVALRLLYLMSGQQDRALATIPGVDAADQEFWKQFFFSISTYFDGQSYPEPTGRAAQTAAQLRTAVERLQDVARLELRNVAFCHKITSFGSFEKFPRDEFTRGQPVLMYAELANFKSVPAADGQYLTRVRSTVEFYNAAGGLAHRITFPETEDLCRNRRRDYYHSYEFAVPADKLQLGPHSLKLIVEDLLSRKVAEETIGFVVK